MAVAKPDGLPPSKLSEVRAAWDRGDRIEALRLTAKFGRLGVERNVILTGWGAHINPNFYRQMGRDPAALVAAGIAAVGARYGLTDGGDDVRA